MLYGYTRVSTIEQAEGTSLAEQSRRVEGVALLRDIDVTEVFTDAGVSGSKPLRLRPAGKAMLSVLQPGDVVVVSKLDRFARNAADALTMAETFKAKGIDHVTTEGTGHFLQEEKGELVAGEMIKFIRAI